MWYAVQVSTGHEEKACGLIEQHVSSEILKAAFVPKYQKKVRVRGEWRDSVCPLFPGYLIVDTRKPELLEARLKGVAVFTRLLGAGDLFVPLSDKECDWIRGFTDSETTPATDPR